MLNFILLNFYLYNNIIIILLLFNNNFFNDYILIKINSTKRVFTMYNTYIYIYISVYI